MKVVYGHTDSIYVKCDSVELATEALVEINAHVRESFPNALGLQEHPVVLEFEKYYSALGVGITKNRNAGLVSWEDGVWLDEPKFTMTGFTAKRISETKLAKRVQTTVLKMWINSDSKEDIDEYCRKEYLDTLSGSVDMLDIIKRSRLNENRLKVKCSCNRKYDVVNLYKIKECNKCANPKKNFKTVEGKRPTYGSGIIGMLYAMEKLNMVFEDSYVYIKVITDGFFTHPLTDEAKPATYIAGSKYADLEGFSPDWKHYAKQVISQAEPIYKAMGWETNSIVSNTQTLERWW
jgi:DNA polymerase elongation subunit (family B)